MSGRGLDKKGKVGSGSDPYLTFISQHRYISFVVVVYLLVVLGYLIVPPFRRAIYGWSGLVYISLLFIFGIFVYFAYFSYIDDKRSKNKNFKRVDERKGPSFIQCSNCGNYEIIMKGVDSTYCGKCKKEISLRLEDLVHVPRRKIQCPRCLQMIYTTAGSKEETDCPNCEVTLVIGK